MNRTKEETASLGLGGGAGCKLGRGFLAAASVAVLASMGGGLPAARAQSAGEAEPKAESQLPPVEIVAPTRHRSNSAPSRRADHGAQRAVQAQHQPQQAPAVPKAFAVSQDARTGQVGVYQNSTSVATKNNTPLVDIPQSISVITKDQIKDQNYQNLTDVTRYVPSVAVHQGEGNRDELVIRGVDSSANFFVNGFRDDVQYFRDF